MWTSIKNKDAQQGYILVELAIVMVVVGVLIAASLPFYNTYTMREAPRKTKEKMQVIENALSNYIQTRFRLPCPADPDPLVTVGGNFGVERLVCNQNGMPGIRASHGIVPYRTLGIPEQYAKDGFGNFFTYVVSPDFTANDFFTTPTDTVHRRLLHHFADVIPAVTVLPPLPAPQVTTPLGSGLSDDLIELNHGLYPRALFCAPRRIVNGPGQVKDITVTQDGVELNLILPHMIVANPGLTDFRRVQNADILTVPDETIDVNLNRDAFVSAFAVGIISHGKNRYGAYQSDGTQIDIPAAMGALAAERVTADNTNREISVRSLNFSAGANEYDDIVNFYTQEEIYAVAGGGSCEHL